MAKIKGRYRRHYHCDACDHRWSEIVDADAPAPDGCPNPVCSSLDPATEDTDAERAAGEARVAAMVESGIAPGVKTNASRAVEYTHKMSEEMGLTDMNDDGRPGTSAFKEEAPAGARQIQDECQQILQAVRESGPAELIPVAPEIAAYTRSTDPREAFFAPGGAVQGKPGPHAMGGSTISGAATVASVTRQEGNDPMARLHQGAKQAHERAVAAGLPGDGYEVVGRVKVPQGAQP